MPDVAKYDDKSEWMEACVPARIEEGDEQDQAVAVCSSIWADRNKAAGVDQGNALKAIGETDDTLTVANYIVLFGGRDLEGLASAKVNADGSKGEYFTPETQVESEYTKTGMLYVDWEHGRGKALDGDDAPGRDDVLGVVDWKTARIDDRGIWVERALHRRGRYMQFLEVLAREGLLGSSSEPVQDEVEVAEDGKITRWPLRRDAITLTPMEPRMISQNALAALKGLAEECPHIKSLVDAARPEAEGPEAGSGEEPAVAAKAEADTTDAETENVTPEEGAKTEEKPMAEKEKATEGVEAQTAPPAPVVDTAELSKSVEALTENTKALIDVAGSMTEVLKKLGQKPDKSALYITEDEADRKLKAHPYKSMGEFLLDVAQAGAHGIMPDRLKPLKSNDPIDENGFSVSKALGDEFVGGLTSAAHKAVGKAPTGLQETVPALGGFLVGTDRAPGLLARVYDIGTLLQRVDMVGLSANSNAMTFYGENETSRANGSRRGGIRGYWAAEAAEKTASYPEFREMELKLRKVIGLVYATDELLQDASALESWILRNLPEELRFVVEDAVINGTGAGQPQGIMNSGALVSVAKETGQAATTIVSENIMKMWSRRWVGARDYVWLINQDCLPQLWQMSLAVGTGGLPVYMPAGGLSQAPYATLVGRPVLEVEYCQTLGTTGDILLVSLGEYQMIEKGGIQSASSIHVRFVYDETCFRFVYRCDGQSKWNSALTPFKGTNTVSPFVALATRS